MAGPLTHYFRHKWPSLLVLLAVVGVLIVAWQWLSGQRYDVAEYSGWLLFTLFVILILYGIRKKITVLPLGRAWYWRRLHTWLGWVALAVFLLHAGWRLPTGVFNGLLWSFMLLVFISGIVGLLMSIAIPPRITRGEERVQLERIPRITNGLLRKADYLMQRVAGEQNTQPLVDLYSSEVRDYLYRHREFWAHCFNTANKARQLNHSLQSLGRYSDKPTAAKADELRVIIDQKHRLDRQYALQRLLRLWTYIHMSFSVSLLLLITLHITIIYAYHLQTGF